MSDLNAIQRIIDACEGGGPDRRYLQEAGRAGLESDSYARASAALETINHLMGAVRPNEYVGRMGSDLVVPPSVLSKMLRAASGERVEIGRLVFLGRSSPKSQADDIGEAP